MELTIKELREKYGDIENKIPSVWKDYEVAGIELAQDICFTWDISDAELIRVIALIALRVAGMGKSSLDLSNHINRDFSFCGLYPNIIKTYNIKPE